MPSQTDLQALAENLTISEILYKIAISILV